MTPKEFAKKIIASINPGTADISGIGDGTIKGAISEQIKKIVKYQDIVLDSVTYQPNVPVYYDYGIGYEQVISIVITSATTPSHIAQFYIRKYGGAGFSIINDYTSALTDAVKIRIFYTAEKI